MLNIKEKIDILTFEGYFERYNELVRESNNYKEAYLKVEAELWDYFKQSRYSSYESFRNAKSKLQNTVKY